MADHGPESVLRFERVVVTFDENPVLRDISFNMRRGETRIILGAAGSGKTVLLKTALGLIRPDSGRVWVFEEDSSDFSEHQWMKLRRRMGMLFQESALFDSLTIEENVAYPLLNQGAPPPPGEVRSRVEEILTFVELEHTLEKFPSELSGGMRRRVGIARAIVTDPPLILYDSPTAGLDPITANTIMELVAKERDTKSATTAIVTHRFQDGELMAKFSYNPGSGKLEPVLRNGTDPVNTVFMVLKEGELVFEGTQAELEQSRDPYVSKFVKH
ncbi:MAG: ATP-binding cassette domain-containing protein [Bryobacterales bacterium]|nr:ATP-binding cassette domain-containing protein [Bryobacterales bacterium]